MTHDEIYRDVAKTLTEMFRLDPASVSLSARLVEDLELDSIDAIDMAAKLQEFTGQRFTESELRRMRTVRDIVNVIENALKAKSEPTE